MSQVSVKGVVIGGVTDIVATNIAALPVVVIAAMQAGVHTLPKAEQAKATADALQNTPSLFLATMFLGMLCSVLGGYVAARIAKRGAVLNGALSAFLCIGFGVYALVAGTNTVSPWMHAAAFLLSPALGALGGYLWEWRQIAKRITPAAA
jgi:hypothetical protein